MKSALAKVILLNMQIYLRHVAIDQPLKKLLKWETTARNQIAATSFPPSIQISSFLAFTHSMTYETRRFNAAFTRALQ